MRYRMSLVLGFVLTAASVAGAHDLFIKLDSYFLPPNAAVRLAVLNGTFLRSENAVTPDRIADLSLRYAKGLARLDLSQWAGDTAAADTSYLTINTEEEGTYVVGVSTRPRELLLAAADFNAYLEHDGVPDVLEARRASGQLDRDARERYSKHVKAVLQVGDRRDRPRTWWRFWLPKTPPYAVPFGYPAEIVPLENPYLLSVGDELAVRCLVDGEPVANQLVIAGGENESGLFVERSARTDADGVVRFLLDSPGRWYIKFINMVPAPQPDVDYESKWATLTFEIRD